MLSSSDRTKKNIIKLIRRLVIQSITKFEADDWEDMVRYLAEKKGNVGLEAILDHFYFNREYWYRRVRNYPPDADGGAENITDPILSKAWDSKLEQYFNDLRDMYRWGKLEGVLRCIDVPMGRR
jgi:hypothetical protein